MEAAIRAPDGFAFARISVPDLDASIEFYRYHVGLDLVDSNGVRARLRAATEHHSIELVAEPGAEAAEVCALGYTIVDDLLDGFVDRLRDAGVTVEALDTADGAPFSRGVSFRDPNGIRIELVSGFQSFADRPTPGVRPETIVHPFIMTPMWEETVAFYTGVLGFRPSDYVGEQTAFLRSENRFHHSLAVHRGSAATVGHICFLMPDFDAVMKLRGRARYKDVPIPVDLVNHSGSGSIALYIHDPQHGPRFELCDGHRQLSPDEHEARVPRRMALDPRNIDTWRAAADDWGTF